MNSNEEKKNERKGMYISLGVHGALLILFFFILAWREPDPPIPEYGIELNFGIDNQGSGTVQRQAPATPTPTKETSETTEEAEQTETQENVTEEAETIEPEEAVEDQVVETVEEVAPQDIESPDVVEEVVEETIETPIEPQPSENELTDADVSEEQAETTEEAGGTNQGDDESEVGDQGDPEGEVDARALYGNPGGGGGASLDMSGWMWDYLPKPDDKSDENGKIVFSITIDDAGEILSIRTLQKTVTPAVERIYKAEVEKLTFSTTSSNSRPATTSSGTITFVIKSN